MKKINTSPFSRISLFQNLVFFFLLPSLLLLPILCYYSRLERVIPYDLYFFRTVSLVSFVIFSFTIGIQKEIKLYPLDLLIGGFVIFLIAKCAFKASTFSYLTIYIVASSIFQRKENIKIFDSFTYWILTAHLFILIILWLKYKDQEILSSGLFMSTGEQGIYFAILFPFLLAKTNFKTTTILQKILVILTLFICIAIIIISDSRTGLLGIAIITFIWLMLKNIKSQTIQGRLFRYRLLLHGIIPLFLSICLWMYLWRPASANGRVLIYKVCLSMIKDKPFTGIGVGNFEAMYNEYQSDYLSDHRNEKFKYLADNNYSAYNEFLQLITELGLPTITFILILLFLLYKYMHSISVNRMNFPISGYALMILFICCLFSFPLSNTSISALGIIFTAQLSCSYKSISSPIVVFRPHLLPLILFKMGTIIYFTLETNALWRDYEARKKWKNIMYQGSQSFSGLDHEKYQELYPVLKLDGRFLYNYGANLILSQDYIKGIVILNDAKKHYSSSDLYLFLGDGYSQLKEINKAENSYLRACNMVPSKLLPKYKLFKLYLNDNKLVKASKMAQLIIETPIKVKSSLTMEILKEAKLYVNSRHKYE